MSVRLPIKAPLSMCEKELTFQVTLSLHRRDPLVPGAISETAKAGASGPVGGTERSGRAQPQAHSELNTIGAIPCAM